MRAARVKAASSSSSARWRPAAPAIARGASSFSIQRAFSAGTKCSVPRIGQVRTTSRAAIACSTVSTSAFASLCPAAQSPPR